MPVLKLLNDHPTLYQLPIWDTPPTPHPSLYCQHACWLHPQQHDSAEKTSPRHQHTYEICADAGSMLKRCPKHERMYRNPPEPSQLDTHYYPGPTPSAVLLTAQESHLKQRRASWLSPLSPGSLCGS